MAGTSQDKAGHDGRRSRHNHRMPTNNRRQKSQLHDRRRLRESQETSFGPPSETKGPVVNADVD
jgi:hypothetical protein